MLLIAFGLLLSSASESPERANPDKTEPQGKESQLQTNESTDQSEPIDRSPPTRVDQPVSSQLNPPAAQSETGEQKTQPTRPTDSNWWFNLFVVVFTGGLLGVGVMQAILYKRQATSMRRGLRLTRRVAQSAQDSAVAAMDTVSLARDNAKIQMRAYLEVTFENTFNLQAEVPISVEFRINNPGSTRAKITWLRTQLYCGPGLPRKIERPDNDDKYKIQVLVPANESIFQTIGSNSSLTPAQRDDVWQGRLTLGVYGLILYDDVFKDNHFTRFCWIFSRRAYSGKGGFVLPDTEADLNDAD
ncbi:MAG TPA: hypothetical protein VFU31_13875 [Candidatus Binatia bacterium]|nr:hypothetical protein [Candidatus Binatia bacterium]